MAVIEFRAQTNLVPANSQKIRLFSVKISIGCQEFWRQPMVPALILTGFRRFLEFVHKITDKLRVDGIARLYFHVYHDAGILLHAVMSHQAA